MDPLVLRARARKQGKDVWLIDIADAAGSATPIRITNNNEDITYDGVTYLHFNCSLTPPEADSDGGTPICDIRISNVTRQFQVDLANNDWFRGGPVKLISFNTSVPSGDYTDDTRYMEVTNHTSDIETVIIHTGLSKEFEEMVQIEEYGAWNCSHVFKDCMCGYSGADTTCVQTRQACRAKGNVDRFGAEPSGLRSGTIRIGV